MTTLFFFGMYEHMVSFPAKANSDLYSARPLGSVNIFGMSLLFLRKVPTIVV